MVIFDCDGVLLDSEIIADQTLLSSLEHWLPGVLPPHHPLRQPGVLEEWLVPTCGKTLQQILQQLSEETGLVIPDSWHHQIEYAIETAVAEQVQAIPGIHELLSSLEQPWVVASNSSYTRLEKTLTAAGLWELCEGRVFSTEPFRPKPAPDLHLHLAEQQGVDPRDCVVIEDSPTGVQAALSANMKAYGFVGGRHMNAFRTQQLSQTGIQSLLHTTHQLQALLQA